MRGRHTIGRRRISQGGRAIDYVLLGLFAGATYALIATGFVFVNSVIDTYPLQQGAMALLYGYVFLYAYEGTESFLLASLLLIPVVVVSSLFVSAFIFERLLGRHFQSLAVGLGLLIIIEEVAAQYFYEGQAVAYPPSLKLEGSFEVVGATVSYNRLLVFGCAVAVAVLLDRFFQRTRPGMGMRAIADSQAGAQLSGVSLVRTVRAAFIVAGISAAVAGVLLGVMQSTISPGLGTPLTTKGLAAALLGGGVSLRGAIGASLLIGVLESVSIGYVSSRFSEVISYAAIIAILFVRPDGLMGRRSLTRA